MGDSSQLPSGSVGRKRSCDDHNDDDEKKKKNRLAAQKHRMKKVQQTEDLKKSNDQLKEDNRQLNAKKLELESILRNCVIEIQKHKQAGCHLPPDVADILDNQSDDFIAIGVRETPVSSVEQGNTSSNSLSDDSSMHSPCSHFMDIEPTISSSVHLKHNNNHHNQNEQNQSLVQGLFSGSQISAPLVVGNNNNKVRTRNPSSSRSTSGSPPISIASPQTPSNSQTQSQIPQQNNSNLNLNSNLNSNLNKAPPAAAAAQQSLWSVFHQQTSNNSTDQTSPVLSPAQTVPNLDLDYQNQTHGINVNDNVNQTINNGGRIINAQDVVTSEPEANNNNMIDYLTMQEDIPLGSNGFSPSLTSPVTPNFNNISSDGTFLPLNTNNSVPVPVVNATGIQNCNNNNTNTTQQPVSIYNVNDLSSSNVVGLSKPSTSSSVAVSMNDQAELLLQAMNAFDRSEISEELRKQYNTCQQLSSEEPNEVVSVQQSLQSENNQVLISNQFESSSNGIAAQSENTVEVQLVNNQGMPYEDVLKLAKAHDKNITLKHNGQEYKCSYEQVRYLVETLTNKKKQQLVNSLDQLPITSYLVDSSDTQQQLNTPTTYIIQDDNGLNTLNLIDNQNTLSTVQTENPQIQYIDENNILIGNIIYPISSLQQIEATPSAVEYTQLPTTVLDQMQDGNGSTLASVSEPVEEEEGILDLPSLSLTEDDTNIFEKRRKR